MDMEVNEEFALVFMVMGALSLWKLIDIVVWIFSHIDISITLK